jgi:hypothetical protein
MTGSVSRARTGRPSKGEQGSVVTRRSSARTSERLERELRPCQIAEVLKVEDESAFRTRVDIAFWERRKVVRAGIVSPAELYHLPAFALQLIQVPGSNFTGQAGRRSYLLSKFSVDITFTEPLTRSLELIQPSANPATKIRTSNPAVTVYVECILTPFYTRSRCTDSTRNAKRPWGPRAWRGARECRRRA